MPTTNALNNQVLNDFTVTNADAGVTRVITLSNTDNTNPASSALLSLVTGGSAGGVPYIAYTIPGSQQWTHGITNATTVPQNDPWRLSASGSLGVNDSIVAQPAGEINYPRTPSFLVYLNVTVSNVTGAGASYTTVWDTEVFDQGNNFDGVSTFTAPVAGKYLFSANVTAASITVAMTRMLVVIVTSNRNYRVPVGNVGAMRSSTNSLAGAATVIADMDAGDTTTIVLFISGGAGDTASFSGPQTPGAPTSFFSGQLIA